MVSPGFICVSVLLCLEDTVFLVFPSSSPLALIVFPSPLPQSFLNDEERDLTETSHIGQRVSRFYGICISSGCGSLVLEKLL